MLKTLLGTLTRLWLLVSIFILILSSIATFFVWQHFWPVKSDAGWSYEVYLDDIPMVSALAMDRQSNLFVSQEFRNGKGLIFKRSRDGTRQDIVTHLSKPDGLAVYQDGIVIGQEVDGAKLLW